MDKLKETKRYIFYKDCIYSKMSYKMLKIYTNRKQNIKYCKVYPEGESKTIKYILIKE